MQAENISETRELHKKAYDAGVLGAMWPAKYGGTPPDAVDTFHDLILWDELARWSLAAAVTVVALKCFVLT